MGDVEGYVVGDALGTVVGEVDGDVLGLVVGEDEGDVVGLVSDEDVLLLYVNNVVAVPALVIASPKGLSELFLSRF